MFGTGRAFTIATVAGIPLKVDPLAFLLALLVGSQVHQEMTVAGVPNATTYAVIGGALAIGSILWHEGAHAVVARLQGIHVTAVTRYMFGGATTMETEGREPRKEFLVAFVGPASSLVLGVLLSS